MNNNIEGCCEFLYKESRKRWIKEEEVFGVSFRFGLDEPIKLSLNLKLGGFYLRINTLRIATIDLLYMFYNKGL